MPCTTLENLFQDHSTLIRNDTAKIVESTDFYIKNMRKEPWLDGNGYQYSYPIYERVLVTKAVTDADFFVDFATLSEEPNNANNNALSTGACGVTGHNIDSFGVTNRQVSLKKAAINTPDICLDDLKFQWQVMDQLHNVSRIMTENTKWVWSNKYQDEYSLAATNKITAGIDAIGTTFDPATPPTSELTFGILEDIHQELGYNGGSINPSARVEDGTPVYTVVGSQYAFNNLKKQGTNRNDFQYASSGGGELQTVMVGVPSLGGKVYHGFKFAAVQFPPRFSIDAGPVYTRIYPYVSSNASRGKKWEVQDAYKNAPYEDAAVWHDDVMKVVIPKPGGSFGPVTYQQAYSWAGEFTWRNIPDRECNVDGNIGFFRALFAYGVKLLRPDLGYIVRYLRCGIDPEFSACS